MGLGANQTIKSFSFSKEEVVLLEDFIAVAKDRGVSCSEQIRQAMALFLEDYTGEVADEENSTATEQQENDDHSNAASGVLLQQLEAQESLDSPSMRLVDACTEDDEMVPIASTHMEEVEAPIAEGFSRVGPISPGLAVAREIARASAAVVDANESESSIARISQASAPTHISSEVAGDLESDDGLSTDLLYFARKKPAAEKPMFPISPESDDLLKLEESLDG